MKLRSIMHTDIQEWSRMRSDLWPDSADHHMAELKLFYSGDSVDIVAVFVVERANGKLAGFVEINIRGFVEGSRSRQVPYIEGWYVDPDARGKGVGRGLIEKAEKWSLEKGFTELGSDAEIENPDGIAAHNALGFKEVYRIVCFMKKL